MESISLLGMLAFLARGLAVSLGLIPVCVAVTIVVGGTLGVLRYRGVHGLNQLIDGYVWVARGVPPLIVLLVLYASTALGAPFAIAVIGLGLYHGAYVVEHVRGNLAEIPSGQLMAAKSLGLSYPYIVGRILLPQTFAGLAPQLAGQYILLVKDTTLVSVVGLQDVMSYADGLVSQTLQPALIYLIIGVIYYLICLGIEVSGLRIERMVRRHLRPARMEGIHA